MITTITIGIILIIGNRIETRQNFSPKQKEREK